MRERAVVVGRPAWELIAAGTALRLVDASKAPALLVLVATMSGSAWITAALAICASLPVIVLGPVIGSQIDRRSPVTVLVWGIGCQAVVLGAMVAATLLSGSYWILVGAGLALGTTQAVNDNAINSALPSIIDRDGLFRANGIMSTGQSIARVVGPVAGTAIAMTASSVLFGAWLVVTVLVLVFLLWRRRFWPVRLGSDPSGEVTQRRSWLGGFIWIRHSRPVRRLLVTVVLNNVAFGAMAVTLPLFAVDTLAIPPASYGLVSSTMAISGILGSALVTTVASRVAVKLAGTLALVMQCLGFCLLSISGAQVVLFCAIGMLGLSSGVWNVVSSTALMRTVPEPLRGRVMATYRSIAFSGSPIGNSAGGALADSAIRLPLYAAAIVSLLVIPVFSRPTQPKAKMESRDQNTD